MSRRFFIIQSCILLFKLLYVFSKCYTVTSVSVGSCFVLPEPCRGGRRSSPRAAGASCPASQSDPGGSERRGACRHQMCAVKWLHLQRTVSVYSIFHKRISASARELKQQQKRGYFGCFSASGTCHWNKRDGNSARDSSQPCAPTLL